jgi:hypothetical protein
MRLMQHENNHMRMIINATNIENASTVFCILIRVPYHLVLLWPP